MLRLTPTSTEKTGWARASNRATPTSTSLLLLLPSLRGHASHTASRTPFHPLTSRSPSLTSRPSEQKKRNERSSNDCRTSSRRKQREYERRRKGWRGLRSWPRVRTWTRAGWVRLRAHCRCPMTRQRTSGGAPEPANGSRLAGEHMHLLPTTCQPARRLHSLFSVHPLSFPFPSQALLLPSQLFDLTHAACTSLRSASSSLLGPGRHRSSLPLRAATRRIQPYESARRRSPLRTG